MDCPPGLLNTWCLMTDRLLPNRISPIALLAMVVGGFAAPVFGQNGTWNTTTNGTWTTASNWLSNTIATGADNTALFTFNITNPLDVSLGANRTIGGITFTDSTTSSHDMTISGADILTLDVTTGTPTIDVTQSGRSLTISSVVAGNDGLRKRGLGSLILTGNNTYSGTTTVAGGTLTLSGTSGAIGSSTAISLLNGGTFKISNTSAANNTNRLGNSTALTATVGGTFNFENDASNTAFAETLGTLTLTAGAFTLNTTQAGASGTSALTLSSISRSAGGGTVLFSGTGFGNSTRNQVLVTTALNSQNVGGGTAILPWALVQDGSTYNLAIGGAASGAVTQLTTYDTTSGSNPTWGATINARPGGNTTLTTQDKSLNSLVLNNGIHLLRGSANSVRTLTIGSSTQAGLIVQTGGSSSIIGDNGNNRATLLQFGTREGIFNTIGTLLVWRGEIGGTPDNLLSGTGGITKTGNGTLTLGSSVRTFLQDFTGALNLNQGLYEIFSDSATAFGNSTNSINFNGGNLTIQDTAARSFNNPLTVNGDATLTSNLFTAGPGVTYTFGTLAINNDPNLTIATGTGATSGNQTVTVGAVTLNSNATFTLTNGSNATTRLSVAAVTNGANTVTVAGSGNLTQTGVWGNGTGGLLLSTGYTGLTTFDQVNTYTGATTINGGTLRAGAAASGQAFGNLSAVTTADVAGALLELNNFSQTIGSLAGGGTTGGNVTLGNATLTTGGGNASTSYAGVISGTSGSLIKTGTGNFTLTNNSTYTGATTISAGILEIGSGGTSGSIASTSGVTNNAALIYNRSNAITAGYATSGNGTVTQAGTGTTTFTANNTYTGTTTVSGGTLLVNAAHTGGAAYTVAASTVLGGTGSTASSLSVSGTLAPGTTTSIETFGSGAVSMLNGSTFAYDINSSVATSVGADLQLIAGNLLISSGVSDVETLSITDLAGSPTAIPQGTTFTLMNYSGTWNGGLLNVGLSEIANGGTFVAGLNTWQLDYNATSGGLNFPAQYVNLNYVNITAVPEPSILFLLAAGGIGGLMYRRRRLAQARG